jgi:hypothetical protein
MAASPGWEGGVEPVHGPQEAAQQITGLLSSSPASASGRPPRKSRKAASLAASLGASLGASAFAERSSGVDGR